MHENFTDRARRALTLANQEAQRLAHDHIGTEHLLLGIVKEGSGLAAIVLQQFRIDLTTVRHEVEKLGHGPSRTSPLKLEHTERLRRVLDYAQSEAAALSHNYVGTEHLLLGLLQEPEGTAARVLAKLDLKLDLVRASVLNLLGKAPLSKEPLLTQAMNDLALHLADHPIEPETARRIADALINAGWRPQQ